MNLHLVQATEPGRCKPEAALRTDEVRLQQRLVRVFAGRLQAQIVETPISWVLLAADEAFKIKKAIRTPFLDYRSLEERRHFCLEEVRLNQRLAGGLYLGVESIGGHPDDPVLGTDSQAIDYAVRMKRFADTALVGNRVRHGLLSAREVDALATLLGGFHAGAAPAVAADGHGSVPHRLAVALAALRGCEGATLPAYGRELSRWMNEEGARLAPLWAARQEHGFMRECHGDLHLDNLLVLPEGPAAFDCIEFDPKLRFIDVVDDIAFPVMDLGAAGRPDLAFRLLNGWLDFTGDHDGLPALRFAAVYRALVRGQVSKMRGSPGRARALAYVRSALAWKRVRPAHLTIMHGLPGSGKTTISQRLLEQHQAVRIRSDVERKRLFGIAPLENSHAAHVDIYGSQAGERTYAQLFARARVALQAGYPVILDAAFLHRHERELAHRLARELHVQFSIAACGAPDAELERRLQQRSGDASEAGVGELRHMRATSEPLAPGELGFVQQFAAA